MLSNRLSKIVAKNDALHNLEKIIPNDIDLEPRSSLFFKINVNNSELPIRVLINNVSVKFADLLQNQL